MTLRRGEYRPIYSVLADSPEFQALSKDARILFYTLKLSLGASGIGVLYDEPILDRSALTADELEVARQELIDTEWIEVQRRVHWIRNGLRFEPTQSLKIDNQKKGIERHLQGLPKLEIVNRFARYYELEPTFPHLDPEPSNDNGSRRGFEGASKGLRSKEHSPEHSPTPSPEPETTPPKPPAAVENSPAGIQPDAKPPSTAASEKLEYTDAELLDAARHELGLNRLDGTALIANSRILNGWLYAEKPRSRSDIWAAIHGAVTLRDAGEIDWLKPGTPAKLAVLVKASTLRDQGDGKAVGSLWDVATDRYYQGDPVEPRRPGADNGPGRVSIKIEAASGAR